MNKKKIIETLEKQVKLLTKDQDIRAINEKIDVSREVRNLYELMMEIENSAHTAAVNENKVTTAQEFMDKSADDSPVDISEMAKIAKSINYISDPSQSIELSRHCHDVVQSIKNSSD